MYTPIGIKTEYSLLESLIKIKDLVLYAKKLDIKSLGILDNNLSGSHKFYLECISNDIKPIIGYDLVIDNYRLFLYAKNYEGLKNLFKISYDLTNKVLSINDLNNYKDNVICVLPYESKDIYETIKNIFEHVFLSYKTVDEYKNISLITDNNIYLNDIRCLSVESSKYLNYLTLIKDNKKIGELEFADYSKNVLTKEEYDTSKLVDLINIEYPKDKRYIPRFDDSKDSKEYLNELANKGLSKRLNGEVSKEYQDRLNYELKVISDMGFQDYFLIVFDYVRYAIKNNIYVGAGRGSAVGSLVAYSLGITSIDPLKYNLIFERFLNPNRVTMPDIDIDFEASRREEVIEYVKNKYGNTHVSKVIAYGTFAPREVIRTVGKLLDIDEREISDLSKALNPKLSLKENLTDEVKNILKNYPSLNKVYKESFYLEGLKKHILAHAAGVVICSNELFDVLPVIKTNDDILTAYDKDELEDMGLLKMDFLSVDNLTVITNTIKSIEESSNKKININQVPLDDNKVYELFAKGDTIGIFQFESKGIRNFLTKLKPNEFNDLIMANAMYRPGPMDNIDTYVARKHGKDKITYPDESLKDILESTYGILVYQEQVMQILVKMAGYNFSEADLIRRAISKKNLDKIEKEKETFINNSIKNGYDKDTATKVYESIVKFGDYGFNKSHAVGYSFIAYQMAYLKVHFSPYFYVNLLENETGEKLKEYIDEAKRSGIKLMKPSINLSNKTYEVEDGGIRLPFKIIKNVGMQTIESILNERESGEFKDFFDFMARCYNKTINKKTLESLILSGVFDEFKISRSTLINNIDTIINYGELIKDLDSSLVSEPVLKEVNEYTDIELMKYEIEYLGFYVSNHPSNKYPKMVKSINLPNNFDKIVECVVLVDRIKTLKTKTGEDMAFIDGSDETGSIDFVAFPKTMKFLNDIKQGDLVKFKGKVERRNDKYQIVIYFVDKYS